ncbi:Eisosomes component [Sporothrix eucalyptigena]|uniref:Eisosomes component n=1 Tax=Sporothrix eucalyptigena TaxID=1812306 RepID=A0ABP0BMV1_9PEZI
MALIHAPFGMAAAVMLGTSIVFLFFIILSGVTSNTPLSKTYFLQADTTGIEGAHDITQWTFLYACGPNNEQCGSAHPAMPFGKVWAPNAANAPAELIGKYGGNTTSYYYYYMWRFGWVFYLIALFFEVLAFFSSFLACCGRLGSSISGLFALIAFVFLIIAVSLMTATFVRARNVFHGVNRDAVLGAYGFGFSWGAVAALLIALILLCAGATRKGNTANVDDGTNGKTSSKRGWRRGRNRRNRAGSFSKVNYEDGRLDNVSA